MIEKILGFLLLVAVACAGYVALEQSLAHKTQNLPSEIKAPEVQAAPKPPVPTPVPPQATPAAPAAPAAPAPLPPVAPTPVVKPPEVPAIVPPKASSLSNHFVVSPSQDHTYRVGFIDGLWPSDYPKSDFYNYVTGSVLEVLKKQQVQLIFLAGAINLTNPKDAVELKFVESKISFLRAFINDKIGNDVKIFPVIECSLEAAEALMPIVFRVFQVDVKDPLGAYDITLENSVLFVTPTHQFDHNANVNNILARVFEANQKAPKYRFVIGYDPVFPINSTESVINPQRSSRKVNLQKNEKERTAFWQMITKEKVLAYFCFGEPVFNRVFEKGAWQIMTGQGDVPTEKLDGSIPFYHAVVLRLPAKEDVHPLVQVLDLNGDVIDEIDLLDTSTPLHQYHISG